MKNESFVCAYEKQSLVKIIGTVEKSVTDKWITRVDGRVVDEYSERSWKGESDGMFYRPDGTSEAWYRSLSVNPGGRTTYVNNQSHYNQDFVIQVNSSRISLLKYSTLISWI